VPDARKVAKVIDRALSECWIKRERDEPMETSSESRKGYLIEVVQHPPGYVANVYPESPQVPHLSPALPPIQCATKEAAFAEARKRIDEQV